MNLKSLQKNWNQFGKTDPLWSILTWDEKKGGKWDVDEFFRTGEDDVKKTMEQVRSLGFSIELGKALDFGCGVGRLTQALAGRFREVHGVDVAPSMIELAAKYNRQGGKCFYHLNQEDNLSEFGDNDLDFIYSRLTLQHMKPEFAKRYIVEFLRILKSSGLLVFQLPNKYRGKKKKNSLKTVLKKNLPAPLIGFYHSARARISGQPYMEMYGIDESEIKEWIEKHGGCVLKVLPDSGGGSEWESLCYFVAKKS